MSAAKPRTIQVPVVEVHVMDVAELAIVAWIANPLSSPTRHGIVGLPFLRPVDRRPGIRNAGMLPPEPRARAAGPRRLSSPSLVRTWPCA